MKYNKRGFTLVELLVVVLIIGVLTSVALPMYQGAVDKTHFSTLLPAARAIKNAEETFYMANGVYTSDPTELDASLNDNNISYTLETANDPGKQFNMVRLENSKLNGVRLASYFDDNTALAGQLHCEAETGNERAQKLCEKLLGGQELKAFNDGYISYLLDQEIDQSTCGASSKSWSTSKTKCYKTTAERCEALGMGVVASIDDQCGYENITGQTVGVEGTCISTVWGGCDRSKVSGGVIWCNGQSTNCGNSSTVTNGGACVDNGVSNVNCYNVQFTNGSICYENSGNGCIASTYDSTSCCCGKHCPSNAPKCADRGITCDPQYMK